MEIGTKTIAAGIGLFLLGVGSTYWLMADSGNSANANTRVQHQPAMQAALSQLGTSEAASNTTANVTSAAQNPTAETSKTLTHESFLAAAEARREQQLADKAEAERLTKLRQLKADSVDCKFWRQQQQTSSTAAKIEEKIKTHCMLPGDISSSASCSADTDPT
jgi:hypothetical protein